MNNELKSENIHQSNPNNIENKKTKDKSILALKVLLIIQVVIFIIMLIFTIKDSKHHTIPKCPNAWGCVCKDDESPCECNYCADENLNPNEECKMIKKVSCPNPNKRW